MKRGFVILVAALMALNVASRPLPTTAPATVHSITQIQTQTGTSLSDTELGQIVGGVTGCYYDFSNGIDVGCCVTVWFITVCVAITLDF